MTTTQHATAPAVVKLNAPEGILRLFVPDGLEISKGDLRKIAAKVAGTIDLGRSPTGKAAKLTNGTTGQTFDFSPVVHRRGEAEDEGTPVGTVVPSEDPRLAVLRTMGFTAEQAAAALSIHDGNAPAAPAASKGKGKGKGKTSKPANAFQAMIQEKGKARAAAAKRCGKCLGFGKVRTVPREKGTYPYAFRTANGAANAPTGVVCDVCHGASVAS